MTTTTTNNWLPGKRGLVGDEHSIKRILVDNEHFIERLLSEGADPNVADSNGNYPLDKAIALQNVELIRKLLERGANPNNIGEVYAPEFGIDINQLFYVIKFGRHDILRLLVEFGLNLNIRIGAETIWYTSYRLTSGLVPMLIDTNINKCHTIPSRDCMVRSISSQMSNVIGMGRVF